MKNIAPFRLFRENRGSIITEFAILAPVILTLGMAGISVSSLYRAQMLAYNAAEVAANVAANELSSANPTGSVSADISGINNICNGAKLAMNPYPIAGKLTIALASVTNSSTVTQPTAYGPTNTTTSYTVDWTNGTNVNSSGTCVTNSSAAVTQPFPLTVGTTPSATITAMVPNPGDSILVAQVTYNYSLPVPFHLPSSYTLIETVFTRPRSGTTAVQ